MSAPATAPSPVRSVFTLAGGGLAGLLAGVDAILLVFLVLMLQGSDSGDLVVVGLGHAGWSAARGVELGVEAGGLAILLAAIGAGAFAAWFLVARRCPGRGPRRTA